MNVLKIKYIWKVLWSLIRSLPIRLGHWRSVMIDIQQCWEATPGFYLSDGGKITIGKDFHARKNVFLRAPSGQIHIGRNVFMNHNVCITSMGNIYIGDGATIANNVVIVDHDHDFRTGIVTQFVTEDIHIGDRVWIGANCTILKGTTIGNDSVIAAGSTVKGVIPENSLFYQKSEVICREIIKTKKEKA